MSHAEIEKEGPVGLALTTARAYVEDELVNTPAHGSYG